MKKYFEVLRKCKLFTDIEDENIIPMLGCVSAKTYTFKKECTILAEGNKAKHIGIVLSGRVNIIRTDYCGNRSIVASFAQSQLFGEAFAFADTGLWQADAVAAENCEIMMLHAEKITAPCCNACGFHSRMIYNLMRIVAQKNIIMNQKIEIISKRTTREKLIAYLMSVAAQHNSDSFTIPYDRQQLADYLAVDRSGLSSEIGKLKKEGIIRCEKNKFQITDISAFEGEQYMLTDVVQSDNR